MGSIKVLYATVERRYRSIEIKNGGLDAGPLLTGSSPPRRHTKRDSHSRSGGRHAEGGYPKGGYFGGTGGGHYHPSMRIGGLCIPGLPCSIPHTEQASSTSDGDDDGSSTTGTPALSSAQGETTTSIDYSPGASIPAAPASELTSTPQASSSTVPTTEAPIINSAVSQMTSFDQSSVPSLSSYALPTSASSDANTSPTTLQAASSEHASKTGAIVGGVLGGLVFLNLFILGAMLFLRRRRRKRTPASAEFRNRYIPRSAAPPPLAAQKSSEDLGEFDGPPPPFTQGDFNDPLFEKIRETQQAHVHYGLAS